MKNNTRKDKSNKLEEIASSVIAGIEKKGFAVVVLKEEKYELLSSSDSNSVENHLRESLSEESERTATPEEHRKSSLLILDNIRRITNGYECNIDGITLGNNLGNFASAFLYRGPLKKSEVVYGIHGYPLTKSASTQLIGRSFTG